ncbi:MAG TPA: hypothetical protein VMV32_12360 [Ignavibacteriaceae bacterium]|nr:hypothetical protein [Ignavibacteriaceae bacterium]
MREENSGLDEVVKRDIDLITCEIPDGKCSCKGYYYKCYLNLERDCETYLNWVVKNEDR